MPIWAAEENKSISRIRHLFQHLRPRVLTIAQFTKHLYAGDRLRVSGNIFTWDAGIEWTLPFHGREGTDLKFDLAEHAPNGTRKVTIEFSCIESDEHLWDTIETGESVKFEGFMQLVRLRHNQPYKGHQIEEWNWTVLGCHPIKSGSTGVLEPLPDALHADFYGLDESQAKSLCAAIASKADAVEVLFLRNVPKGALPTINIGNMPKLASLSIHYGFVYDRDFSELSRLPNLKYLDISNGSFLTGDTLTTISKIKSLETLKIDVTLDMSPEDFKKLGALVNLKSLILGRVVKYEKQENGLNAAVFNDVSVDFHSVIPHCDVITMWKRD